MNTDVNIKLLEVSEADANDQGFLRLWRRYRQEHEKGTWHDLINEAMQELMIEMRKSDNNQNNGGDTK